MTMRIKRLLLVIIGLPVLLCLLLVFLGALYRAPEMIPAGVVGERVAVGDVGLRIEQRGAGPDVVLLHGSPGALEDWDVVAEALSRSYRVTRMDRPGQGWSDAGDRADFEYNAEVVLRMMRSRGLHDVIVVGHSFGGSVALALAEKKPPEVKGVVVVATRGIANDAPTAGMRLLAVPWLGVGLARLTAARVGPGMIRTGLSAKWHPNEAEIPAGYIDARVALWIEPKIFVTTARERLLARERAELVAHYGDIRKPVVILMGTDDHPNAEQARAMAKAIVGARLVMIPGVGHFVQNVRPALVVQAIDGLRDGTDLGRRP